MVDRVAFVTGASRGIGRASAIALAEHGFDVVVTARTTREGSSADGRPLPGSTESTAAEVRARGRAALPLFLDLLDFATIDAALERTFSEWGRIDVLLNNGIYTGEGSLELFMDLEDTTLDKLFRANVFAQIHVTQQVLPSMLARGDGAVINVVSAAGVGDPPAPAGRGGWGYAYAASKAAFHRMAGVLAVEHAGSGVRFHNLDPGFVMTEAMKLNDPEGEIARRLRASPPTLPAAAVAWLAEAPEAADWNGRTLLAPKWARQRGLHRDGP